MMTLLTTYSWHTDNTEIKTGQKCCCFIPIRDSGRYARTVYHGGYSETSESVLVREIAKFSNQLHFLEETDDKIATPSKESKLEYGTTDKCRTLSTHNSCDSKVRF